MDFKTKLLEFRAKHDLTQKQLSKLFGVNSNMIFRYEAGLNKPKATNKIKFEQKMKEWDLKNEI